MDVLCSLLCLLSIRKHVKQGIQGLPAHHHVVILHSYLQQGTAYNLKKKEDYTVLVYSVKSDHFRYIL